MLGAGIVGVVISTVLACKATLKAPQIVAEAKETYECIEQARGMDDYSEDDRKQDLVKATVQTGFKFVKLYAVPTVLMGASLFCILKGHNITVKRNAALTSAVTALSTGYKAYRDRVKDAVGEDKELDIYHGRKTETVEEVNPETGKVEKKKITKVADPTKISPYSAFFDEASPNWTTSPEMNKTFLLCQQNYCNDRLRINKHLFLNEVLDMLGLPRTSAGQVVGWVMCDDCDSDNFVDFGIFNGDNPQARRFVNGDEPSVLLDFNVDGVVYDKI
jgi:hypothetical protein